MKTIGIAFLLGVGLCGSVRADLTISQKVDGAGGGVRDLTMKIKGDKIRVEMGSQMTAIFNGKTGEMSTLMNDQKIVVRMSADKMKAALEMLNQFTDKAEKKEPAEKAKLVATGKKETVGGYETEQYVYDTPGFNVTYWIAPKFPDGEAVLKQLQAVNPDVWKTAKVPIPDYRDFPGLPVKTVMTMTGKEITVTIVGVKRDPLSDADFTVPSDYREMKLPGMGSLKVESASPPPAPQP
jgi:hypothetical protein